MIFEKLFNNERRLTMKSSCNGEYFLFKISKCISRDRRMEATCLNTKIAEIIDQC